MTVSHGTPSACAAADQRRLADAGITPQADGDACAAGGAEDGDERGCSSVSRECPSRVRASADGVCGLPSHSSECDSESRCFHTRAPPGDIQEIAAEGRLDDRQTMSRCLVFADLLLVSRTGGHVRRAVDRLRERRRAAAECSAADLPRVASTVRHTQLRRSVSERAHAFAAVKAVVPAPAAVLPAHRVCE